MPDHSKDVNAAIAHEVTAQAGSNFTCAMLFLSKPQQKALEAVYAFTRHTDDLVDDAEYAECRAERLDAWREALKNALAGQGDISGEFISRHDEAILRQFVEMAEAFNIPQKPAFNVIDGCQMDLAHQPVENFENLRNYCYHVASSVGLMCLPIFGAPEATEYAEKLGIAFQLTNILRDVSSDLAEGRVYLPRDEMETYGVTQDDLAAGVMTDGLRRMIKMQADRAQQYYDEAEALRPRTNPRRVLAAQLMRNVYHRILLKLKHNQYDIFGGRIRISKAAKIMCAAKTWVLGR